VGIDETMEKTTFRWILLLSLLFALAEAPCASAFESTTELHLKIMGTKDAAPPHVFEEAVFFTQKPSYPVRYIGIAFSHEDFRKVHLFERNQKGVLFHVYPIPEGLKHLDYRIIIDGLWTTDSTNPLKVRDLDGIAVSRFEIPPALAEPKLNSPNYEPKTRTAEFNMKAGPGRTVFVTGTFNGWDPYMHRLEEVKPGLYSISLKILPGIHYYYYVVDGMRKTDPLNRELGADSDGNEVSVLHASR